jgi:hypothetical protein
VVRVRPTGGRSGVTLADKERLGAAWVEAGLGEHASVAAFARFVLHLLSLGAPPDLLHDAIAAMDDEVRHAQVCFGVARLFNGKSLGPGPMELSRVFEQSDDSEAILRAAIAEGCVDETISARGAHVASSMTGDTSLRASIQGLADDETRHAELSWRFVEWMLRKQPGLVPEAERCFAAALAELMEPDEADENRDLQWMERFGQLTGSTKQRVRAETLREEIEPRVRKLFGHIPLAHGSAAEIAAHSTGD